MNDHLELLIKNNFSWEDQLILEEAFTLAEISDEDLEADFIKMINKNYCDFCHKVDARIKIEESYSDPVEL